MTILGKEWIENILSSITILLNTQTIQIKLSILSSSKIEAKISSNFFKCNKFHLKNTEIKLCLYY